ASDGKLVLTNVSDGKVRASFALYRQEYRNNHGGYLVFSPDGKTVIAASDPAVPAIVLWDTTNSGIRLLADGSPALPTCLAASPDGRTFALGRSAGYALIVSSVILVDRATGEERDVGLWTYGQVSAVVYSPDGKLMAYAGDRNIWVNLWDVR